MAQQSQLSYFFKKPNKLTEEAEALPVQDDAETVVIESFPDGSSANAHCEYSSGEASSDDEIDVIPGDVSQQQQKRKKCEKGGTSKKRNKRSFVRRWLDKKEFKPWLEEGSDGSSRCKICPKRIRNKIDALEKHMKSDTHIRSMTQFAELNDVRPIDETYCKTEISSSTKTVELKIAAFIAEHCSISAVDHLGELLTAMFPTVKLIQNIKIHRTKCSRLLDSVLRPAFLAELLEDIGDRAFSLIIDESTDVGTLKMLCIVVRYFSQQKHRLVTTFYRMICLNGCDANAITQSILDCLKQDRLDIQRLVGIGTDNASVMVGQFNSVFTKLREHQPLLLLMRCVCHSLALAASKAVEALPTTLDFMVEQTYSWFSRSNKRQMEFAEIYTLINDKGPLKILKHSATRWLSRFECISRILGQWDELKLYFQSLVDTERSYAVVQLAQMYGDVTNKIYLIFLRSHLELVTNVNKKFQAENANPLKLVVHLVDCYEKILQKIVLPTHFKRVKPDQLRNFEFQQHLRSPATVDISWELNEEFGQCRITGDAKVLILERCRRFLIELANQIRSRLPESLDVLELVRMLDPMFAMTADSAAIRPLLLTLPDLGINREQAAAEYGLLHKCCWDRSSLSDPVVFWMDVYKKEGMQPDGRFINISKFALSILALPFSNASVERVFSIMNIVKSRLRNRMQVKMLDSILGVHYGLAIRGEFCNTFTVTPPMLKLFNMNMYLTDASISTDEAEDSDDLFSMLSE